MKRIDGNNLNQKDLYGFIKLMSLGDLDNADAFGIFNGKGEFKEGGKFNYKKLNAEDILSNNFIVGHNRLATNLCCYYEAPQPIENKKLGMIIPLNNVLNAGLSPFQGFFGSNIVLFPEDSPIPKKEDNPKNKIKKQRPKPNFNDNLNNHPFTVGDFILVHNGSISNNLSLRKKFNIKTDITTDSFVVVYLIDKFLKELVKKNKSIDGKSIDRKSLVIEAIKKTMDLMRGRFSVFLYDKKGKTLYYFKNSRAFFYFYQPEENLFVGSTDFENFEYVYKDKKAFQKLIKPLSGKIYVVNGENRDKPFLEIVGDFNQNLAYKKTPKPKSSEEEDKSFWKRSFRLISKDKSLKKKKQSQKKHKSKTKTNSTYTELKGGKEKR